MNKLSIRITSVVLLGLLMAFSGIAQDREDRDAVSAAAGGLYVVSAVAGGVNHVEGPVTIKRADGTSGQLLRGDTVEDGDVVTTGAKGRAEILMNPGSYIRIDSNSEFDFGSTALENLTVNVRRGTAIFEVYASDDFKVHLNAAGSNFYLIKSGIYRLDVFSNGTARLEVWNGRAEADGTDNSLKKGRVAVAANGNTTVSKFNRNMDEFEQWSKARAKEIAESTKALVNERLSRNVLTGFQNNLWNCYDTIGLWVFNRQFNRFNFLPFGYGWRTPYGFSLSANTPICDNPGYYRDPIYIPYPPNSGTGGNGGGNGGGTGGGTPTVVPQENIDRAIRLQTPPFQRMEQSGGVSRRGSSDTSVGFPNRSGNYGNTGNTSTGTSTNTNTTTTSSPPPPSSPPIQNTFPTRTVSKDDN